MLKKPSGFHLKLLTITNTFSKVSGYEINIKIAAFYIPLGNLQRKTPEGKKILFMAALKK